MTKTEIMHIRITDDDYRKIKELANEDNRTITSFVRNIVVQKIKKEEVKDNQRLCS